MRNRPTASARPGRPPGAQSVYRAVDLLKTLTARRNIGWRLSDLARHCGLDDSTAHRIVACLAALRLVKQRTQDRRYVPGPLLYELALTMPTYSVLRDGCRRSLARLARKTGWVASLHLRAGEESVCIDRTDISSMQLMIEVGSRRPLAGFAIGAAMLLALPEKEQRLLLAAGRRQMAAASHGRARACARIWERSRKRGFGLSLGDVIPGVASAGVAVLDAAGRPFGAIGVTGPLAEFSPKRIGDAGQWLREEARRIEREQAALIAELSR